MEAAEFDENKSENIEKSDNIKVFMIYQKKK